jgi:hypothetical protein
MIVDFAEAEQSPPRTSPATTVTALRDCGSRTDHNRRRSCRSSACAPRPAVGSNYGDEHLPSSLSICTFAG